MLLDDVGEGIEVLAVAENLGASIGLDEFAVEVGRRGAVEGSSAKVELW
jgi:hypothetical protein